MFVHPELGYFDEREDLTAAKLYAPSRLAIGKARGLPPIAFRSKVFADLEDEKIWTRSWVFVGALDQIPESGDLLPYTIGHHGLHVQRTTGGDLVGRFNKAQHGGCRAVPAQCQTGIKTKCSFTSCGYSRDRDVIPSSELGEDTPAMRQYLGEQPDRLLSARVESFGPFVHASLDRAAPSLEAELGPVAEHMAPYVKAKLRGVAGFWAEHQCNWKLAGRAFMDQAEVPHMAPVAAKRGAKPKSAAVAHGARFVAREIGLSGVEGDLPVLATLDEKARMGATLIWSFPNLLIAALPDHVVTIGLQPTSFSSTMHRVRLYVGFGAKGVTAEHPGIIKRLDFWRALLARIGERSKAEQLETMRWGTPSLPATAGKKRPIETSDYGYHFQRFLIDRLLAEHDYYWAGPLTDARIGHGP